jgi:uncharacterized protein YndB with AHSA1/START domain
MPERELHLERVVGAPPDRVFAACVDAEALAEWWGPTGFTSTVKALDARVGGRYRIAMQPPDGNGKSNISPPHCGGTRGSRWAHLG